MSIARRLRRHWALAAVCAVFLLAGARQLDDYMYSVDVGAQRAVGRAALDYLAGDGERALDRTQYAHDRYYGAAFEAPLVLVERILGQGGRNRELYLGRHFLTHLFFLLGGAFCYLLAYRLFGSRPLALIAMVLFLLHPRIYAHSFFNSKDVPFLAMFMIALYLVHRAFRRDTLGAFILCGAGVGLLVNLRIMGIVLFAAVLALRALDLAFASSRGERKRVLLTGAAFALAAMLTYHASLPVLWTDPFGRFAELVGVLGSHPFVPVELFRGEWRYSAHGPSFDYVPVWVAITTPPVTLLLAATGALALAWSALRRPRDLLRNGPMRFGILLAALPVVTMVAIVVLDTNVSDNWRQLFFLYAPLPLLAIHGLQRLASSARGQWVRAGTYALAGTAIGVTVVSLARVHPNGDVSFTSLTDRATPERLASRYGPSPPQSQTYAFDIAAEYQSAALFTAFREYLRIERMLPPDVRERLVDTRDFRSGERNFHELRDGQPCPASAPYVSRVHATTLRCIVDPVAYFGELRRRALATEPLDRSRFHAHRVGNLMVYVRDGCEAGDMELWFFLRVYPVAVEDLPDRLREFPGHRGAYGFERLDFAFKRYGVRIDGDCVAAVPLPAYPVARIETGQYTPAWAGAARRGAADAEPAARSAFDVWLDEDGRALTWVREGCSAEDTEVRFFLHVHPVNEDDLPAWRTEHGFDNLDFRFRTAGAFTEDGACVAVAPLPAYPIASVHTGQFASGGAWSSRWSTTRWAVRFAYAPPEIDADLLAREPLARSVFNVWRDGAALVYVKDGCTEADAGARFALHLYPVDEADLSAARREHGFENRDFFLWERGARTDGRCLAVAPLPAWPIARVETGQYDEGGRRWWAGFALPQ